MSGFKAKTLYVWIQISCSETGPVVAATIDLSQYSKFGTGTKHHIKVEHQFFTAVVVK